MSTDTQKPLRKVINGHVLIMPGECHQFHDDQTPGTRCPVCEGGLSVCSVCGTYEAGLDEPCKGPNGPLAAMVTRSSETVTNADLLALIDQPGTFERQTETTTDGWILDCETSEVLGRADIPEAFVVDSTDAAEWVLELRSAIEGNLAGIRARKAALLQQLDAMERRERQRLNWWEFRFAPTLIEFARSCLTGKSKTANFAWGKVAFRATKGTTTILDMDEAVAWMKAYAPDRVKVKETVTATDVLAVRDQEEHLNWIKSTGPGESITISTGVET